MEQKAIVEVLRDRYGICDAKIELIRDSGSVAYKVFSSEEEYFLRIVKPAFMKTAVSSVAIHSFLQERQFAVPKIIKTSDQKDYIVIEEENGGQLFVLYEYIEGGEPDRDADIEEIGSLIGQFHALMQSYEGELVAHDKYFFIDRYIELLGKMKYPNEMVILFREYGDILWERVKNIPRGYCHGDLYIGNIHKSLSGKLYVLDFDTSCDAFPVYDIALVCNAADYFTFDINGFHKTNEYIARFLTGYNQYQVVGERERKSIHDLLAIYHYQLQATIIEVYGLDCVDHQFLDKQWDWLTKWEELRT